MELNLCPNDEIKAKNPSLIKSNLVTMIIAFLFLFLASVSTNFLILCAFYRKASLRTISNR